jgi:hypothetical protein
MTTTNTTLNSNQLGVGSLGTSGSVDDASAKLDEKLNKNAVKQMNLMARQSDTQLMQTLVKQSSDVVNSAKENTSNVRL